MGLNLSALLGHSKLNYLIALDFLRHRRWWTTFLVNKNNVFYRQYMNQQHNPRSPRFDVSLSATLHSRQGVTVIGQVKNISLTGVLLSPDEHNVPINYGGEVNLEVYVPEDGHIRSYKIPMRVSRLDRRVVGMQVDSTNEQASETLRAIVEHATRESGKD